MPRRALIYTDLQAGEGGEEERLRSNPAVPLQRWRVERFYADLASLYAEHGCRYLIDLGDTTDDRKALPVPTINAVMGGLNRIRPDPTLSIKLIGNHEQAYRDSGQHPGLAYQQFHHVVDDREIIFVGSTAIICIAWQEEDADRVSLWLLEQIRRCRENYRGVTQVLVLGHLQLDQALVNGRKLPGGVDTTCLGADLVLLGHVHQPQTIAGNIHYVGSPFQQDYGEMNQAKRVGLLDLDTLALEWLSLPSAYPRYLRLSLTELEAYQSVGEDRITVTLRSVEEAARFHAHPLAALVDPDYQLAAKTDANPLTFAVNTLPEDVLGDYVEKRPLDGFTSEELLALGRELTGL